MSLFRRSALLGKPLAYFMILAGGFLAACNIFFLLNHNFTDYVVNISMPLLLGIGGIIYLEVISSK